MRAAAARAASSAPVTSRMFAEGSLATMARRPLRRLAVSAAALALAGILAPHALGSGLLDRNASRIRLAVDARGQALVTYRVRGRPRHVLVFGAVNALPPSESTPQVRFTIDY